MTYQIETEADLIKALKECSDGDMIRSVSPIIGTTTNNICTKSVDFEIEIHVVSRTYGKVENITPYLTITKSGVIMPVIFGIKPHTPTTWQEDGLQYGIKIDGAESVHIIEPIVTEMSYAGILVDDCKETTIHGGKFVDCAINKEGYGFGHPLCFSQKSGQTATVYGGYFARNRHNVMCSYDENDVTLIGCNFHPCIDHKYGQQLVDRHSRVKDGVKMGGRNFTIKNCRFYNEKNYAYDLPKHSGTITIEGNTFARPFGMNGRVGSVMESDGIANYKNNLYA